MFTTSLLLRITAVSSGERPAESVESSTPEPVSANAARTIASSAAVSPIIVAERSVVCCSRHGLPMASLEASSAIIDIEAVALDSTARRTRGLPRQCSGATVNATGCAAGSATGSATEKQAVQQLMQQTVQQLMKRAVQRRPVQAKFEWGCRPSLACGAKLGHRRFPIPPPLYSTSCRMHQWLTRQWLTCQWLTRQCLTRQCLTR